ncbi:MAG: phosphoribosylanthranilate isomerase [Polyangiaceae bacterium]
MTTHVKICGVTTEEDAILAVDAGASAIGLNFVPSSPRRIDVRRARAIARAVRGRTLVVGVVADMEAPAMRELLKRAELECLQLHGDETPATLAALLPHAYKAVHVGSAADVERARAYQGMYLLVDARVEGALGGTGKTLDWSLVAGIARDRKLTLAGGLTAANVADAIRAVHPYCVDVATGVESAPGVKDPEKLRAFIEAAQRA